MTSKPDVTPVTPEQATSTQEQPPEGWDPTAAYPIEGEPNPKDKDGRQNA